MPTPAKSYPDSSQTQHSKRNDGGFVYLAINLVTRKIYVGMTSSTLKKRWDEHVRRSKNGSKTLFHKSLLKHGPENFFVTELEYCGNRRSLAEAEVSWISRLDACNQLVGYNLTFGGEGFALNQEGKHRLSAAMQATLSTPEMRAKWAAVQNKRFEDPEEMRKVAERTKARTERYWATHTKKIVLSRKEFWANEECRAQVRNSKRKTTDTPEWRARRSEHFKRIWRDPEIRAKMMASRAAVKRQRSSGWKHSEETKQKIRESQIKRHLKVK